MTTAVDVRPPGRFRRRAVVLAAAVLLLVAAAGAGRWLLHHSFAGPVPPVVPANPAEPKVTAILEKVRAEVLRQPYSAQAWGHLAQAFICNDMEVEAKICCAEAERLDPNNPRWPYYQAGVLINQGKQEAALPYLQRAVKLCAVAEPDNPVPQQLLAEMLLAVGRLDEAEEQFRQVLAQRPDEVRSHYGLALVCSARQDWQASRTHLLRCLDNPYAQQKACLQLAALSQRLGDSANAEKFRKQANRLPSDREWFDPYVAEYLPWAVKKQKRFYLAELLESSGQLKESAVLLRHLLQDYPDDYLPRLQLGKILGRLGELREAERLLREALRQAPEKVQIHYFLGLVLMKRAEKAAQNGEDSQAEKLYREAAQRVREALMIKRDYGLAYMILGLSLKHLGQRADALAALRQAVRCNPEYADPHFYLGEMLAEEGQNEEARAQLEQAVEMAPSNAPWKADALTRLAAAKK